jgi:hypothetical protein
MTPRPLSYPAQVVVHFVNPASVLSSTVSLRGFVGSVFAASGKPSRMRATHRLALGTLRTGEATTAGTTGTLETPVFVTFGPPTDVAESESWSCELTIDLVLRDGETYAHTFDVAAQVAPVIGKIRAEAWYDPLLRPIVIEVGVIELRDIESSVGVAPWEDNEERIRVRITEMNEL